MSAFARMARALFVRRGRMAVVTAHITTTHSPRDNRIFRKECSGLAAGGANIHLICPGNDDCVENGVAIHGIGSFGSRLSRMVLGPIRVFRVVCRIRPQAIHAHDPELVPLLALVRMVMPGIRIIYDAHEDLPGQVMSKHYIPIRLRRLVYFFSLVLCRLAALISDGIVVATPAISSRYPASKTVLVQNFPWRSDFPYVGDVSPEFDAVYVGGLNEIRGGVQLVDALELGTGDLNCLMAGPLSKGVEDSVLESSRVHYLGNLSAEQVPGVISKGLVGVVCFLPAPNHIESQPTKMFEYMAAGRAFICSDFPLWREMVNRFECGILVNPESPSEIATAISGAIVDRERTLRLGKNGRRAFEEHYTFDVELPKLSDLYRMLGLMSPDR